MNGGEQLVKKGEKEILKNEAAEEEIVDDQNDLLLASYTTGTRNPKSQESSEEHVQKTQ